MAQNNKELEKAIDVLTVALQADPEYFMAWQANIAMAIYDRLDVDDRDRVFHKACNDGAKAFLEILINQPKNQP